MLYTPEETAVISSVEDLYKVFDDANRRGSTPSPNLVLSMISAFENVSVETRVKLLRERNPRTYIACHYDMVEDQTIWQKYATMITTYNLLVTGERSDMADKIQEISGIFKTGPRLS